MMWAKALPCIALLLLTFEATSATKQCNLYNFGLQGAYQCALTWWQNHDIGQIIDVRHKASDLAESILPGFGIDFNQTNKLLNGKIGANSTDPLAKIIESGLTVEPYIAYMVADLILGFDLTPEELQRLNIPKNIASLLVDRTLLTNMYRDYFRFSCSDYGVRPFVTCMKGWINENCAAEDNSKALVDFMENFENFYCDGKSVNISLLNTLTKDLGTVFKDVVEFMGLYKDVNSPYLFNLSSNSLIYNQTLLQKLGSALLDDCGYFVNALTIELTSSASENATLGAGVIVETFLRASNAYSGCALRTFKTFFPKLFKENSAWLRHMTLINKRYGQKRISFDKTNVASPRRHTVTVFGDPHMILYQASNPTTCPALGWHNYLDNEFFTLRGFASPAAPKTSASYVKKVEIKFRSRNQKVSYESAEGEVPSTVLKSTQSTDEIKLVQTGNAVEILDLKSGAIFVFKKYLDTYYFTVRMGEDVFDSSLGLLITGCPNPMKISESNTGRKKRNTAECEQACSSVRLALRQTCVFDCDTTDDLKVADIAKGVDEIVEQVQSKDSEILQVLPKPTTIAPTKTTSSGEFVKITTTVLLSTVFSLAFF